MKTRSKTITILGIAAVFLFNTALVFADEKIGSKEQLVAKYALREMNDKVKVAEVTLEFLFEGGSYYIRTSQSAGRYTYYAIGCQDGNGSWYLWSNTGWAKATVDSPALTLLKNVRTAVRGNVTHKTVVDKLISDNRVQTYGYEIEIPNAAVLKNCAARIESLQKIGEDGKARLKEVLSDGTTVPTDAEGISGDVVIALYRDSGTGDGIVFKRKSGLFSGESALFNRSEYRSYSYTEKALALFYQFFVSKNQQQLFDEFVTKHYGVELTVNRTLFASLTADEKKAIFAKLTAVLSNGMTETFRQTVNGKSVFGNAKGSGIARFLYGDKRNVYVDTYLALCYEQFRPVFASVVRDQQKLVAYDPEKYTRLYVEDGKELADAAMRYFTWGVEYKLQDSELKKNEKNETSLYEGASLFSELFKYNLTNKTWDAPWFTVNDVKIKNYWSGALHQLTGLPKKVNTANDAVTIDINFGSISEFFSPYFVPFKNGVSGYPIPYAKNGTDSPRTFAYKMYEQLRARSDSKKIIDSTTTVVKDFGQYSQIQNGSYKPFLPGGKTGLLNEAGIDTLGLVSGSIAMTNFYDRVYDLRHSRPAFELDSYYAMSSAGPGRDATGKPLYAKAQQDWSGLVFEAEDLERSSVVVPDLSNLQLGDLVVRFGDAASSNPTHVGIVVGLKGSLPTIQTDQRGYLQNVYVVSVRSGFRQVTLGTWGNPEAGGFGGFTKEPEKYHVRRLLKRKEIGVDAAYTLAKWDLLDKTPAKFELSVNAMQEQTRIGAVGLKERWIPNTGEYLLFTDARLSATAIGGGIIDLRALDPGDLELFVAGADDRGYDVNKPVATYGNIYCNSSASFEVALVPKGNGQAVKLGTLAKSVDKEWSYTLNCAGSQLYDETSGKNKAGTSELFLKNRLWLNPDGRIVGMVNGEEYNLGLRPANSASTRPGDDLLLKIGIRKRGESEAIAYSLTDPQNGTVSVSAVATMKEVDYVATYDKKLLWRANLYIDEGKAKDWNDIHRWDSADNEWNRYQDGKTTFIGQSNLTVVTEQNSKQLGVIPGGQVVKIADFTPARPTLIDGAVAYSYPLHNYEPIQTATPGAGPQAGDSGSMDSPFDFNKKMIVQKELLAKWYNKTGLKFNKPKDQWPAGITKAQDFGTFENYKTNAVNVEKDLTADPQWYTKVPTIDSWNDTKAPFSKWWNYAREEKTPTQAFIPSLGLRLLSATSTEALPAGVTIDDLKKQRIVEAGTDCIGFAKRAASYASPSPYKWDNIGAEWTAGAGSNEIYDVMTAARANSRTYPRCPTDLVIAGQISDSILYHTPNDQFSKFAQDDLKRIAPGDVFYWTYWKLVNDSGVAQGPVAYTTAAKDANPAATGTKWITTSHIGIVSSIIANEAGDITNIQLIESTYDGSIQYVQKTMASITYNVRPYHIVRLRSN